MKMNEIIEKLLEEKVIFQFLFYIGGILLFIIGLYIILFTCQFFQILNENVVTNIEILNSTTQYTCNSYWSLVGITALLMAFLIFSLPLLQLIVLIILKPFIKKKE